MAAGAPRRAASGILIVRVGLIAEGPADLAVLSNLVRGVLGIGRDDIQFIRPELTRMEPHSRRGYRPRAVREPLPLPDPAVCGPRDERDRLDLAEVALSITGSNGRDIVIP